ncbi:PQQ-binding-like beta-propeller repeat protein [Planctomycetes bacterium K23_9]|uniref:Outer membrane biogenesis protein BamB n=1 Tax=Stieleria marina TaxID=1930275 RepID=A0A517NXY4_9BACT|nr:outer membrane biogenesis protein BamB [Planctomycetes bacterium K23_9]
MPSRLIKPQLSVLVAATAFLVTTTAYADWTRFRGPNGSGISPSDAPTEFGFNKNLKWKRELPGRGISSPIVVDNKVFVTCYSGYGMGDDEGKMEDLKRHLVCVDRKSGKTMWTKTVDAKMPEDEWRPPGVTTHGYASNTPTSDGTYVYAFFGKSGVYAYGLDGTEIWNQSVGDQPSFKGFGSAASPIVTDEHVIVNAADESLAIVWLDKKTGKEVHRAEAEGLGECWTTPILVKNGEDSEIALSVIGEIWGLSNSTGKLRWYANGVNARNAQVSLIADDGVVYASGEEGFAVRVDGKGDVSKSNTLWEGSIRTRYATPVLVDGHLYSVSGTVVECINAKTGERVFQERLPSGTNNTKAEEPRDQSGDRDSGRGGGGGGRGGGGGGRGGGGGGRGGGDFASPVVAGGKIFITTNSGMVHVIEAKPEFKVLASNNITFDRSGFGATPAVSDECLFLRSNTTLYCVGAN